MIKWAIKMAPYGISYEPRRAIKAQALADFIAKCSTPPHGDEQQVEPSAAWMLYVDGSTTSEGSGSGLIVVSPEGHMYEHGLKFLFKASNNEAKYEALLASIDLCYVLWVEHLRAFSDSQLIVSNVKGEYEPHDVTMVALSSKVKEKSSFFKKFKIKHVPRSENQ